MNTDEQELMEKFQQGEKCKALEFKSGCKRHILRAKPENTSDARKRSFLMCAARNICSQRIKSLVVGGTVPSVFSVIKNHPCSSVFICGLKIEMRSGRFPEAKDQ